MHRYKKPWLEIFGIKCTIVKKFYDLDYKAPRGKNGFYYYKNTESGIKLQFPIDKMETFVQKVNKCNEMGVEIRVPAFYPMSSKIEDQYNNLAFKITGLRRLSKDPNTCQFILKVDTNSIYVERMDQAVARDLKLKNILN